MFSTRVKITLNVTLFNHPMAFSRTQELLCIKYKTKMLQRERNLDLKLLCILLVFFLKYVILTKWVFNEKQCTGFRMITISKIKEKDLADQFPFV